jgi:hypothetical protein
MYVRESYVSMKVREKAVQPALNSGWTDSWLTGSDCVGRASADSSMNPEGSAPIHYRRRESSEGLDHPCHDSLSRCRPRRFRLRMSARFDRRSLHRPDSHPHWDRDPRPTGRSQTCWRHRHSSRHLAWPRIAHHGNPDHTATFDHQVCNRVRNRDHAAERIGRHAGSAPPRFTNC